MKIAIGTLGFGDTARPDIALEMARGCEELGFSTLWAGEHMVIPEGYQSQYQYARGADLPVDNTTPANNPLVAFAHAAAVTTRLRFATGVVIVPQYNPVLLAKLAATVDFLSSGRLVLGIGIGWLKEEFEAMQSPEAPLTWDGRAKRTRDFVGAMRALWEQEFSSFESESVRFENIRCYPKPTNGTVPVYYGGHTDIAVKRAARYCDGIFLYNLTPDEARERIAFLEEQMAVNGRTMDGFEIVIGGLFDMTPDMLPDYAATGAHELMLQPHHLLAAGGGFYARVDDKVKASAMRPALKQLAEEWVKPAAALEAGAAV